MHTKKFLLVVICAALVALAGCRSSPVYNVQSAPVASSSSNASMEDVKQAIVRAGASLGWAMQPVEPGHIVATLHIRSHMAQVDIKYDTNNYSITYKDSANLNYDGTNIHSNYNGWIQNLDNRIKTNLVNVGVGA